MLTGSERFRSRGLTARNRNAATIASAEYTNEPANNVRRTKLTIIGGEQQSSQYNGSMPDKKAGGDAKPPSFEEGLEQLEAIVKEMENGELPLERALDLFERGMKLSDACRKQLEEAETRVEILTRRAGEMQPEPFGEGGK